jgi:hypothetical protein
MSTFKTGHHRTFMSAEAMLKLAMSHGTAFLKYGQKPWFDIVGQLVLAMYFDEKRLLHFSG